MNVPGLTSDAVAITCDVLAGRSADEPSREVADHVLTAMARSERGALAAGRLRGRPHDPGARSAAAFVIAEAVISDPHGVQRRLADAVRGARAARAAETGPTKAGSVEVGSLHRVARHRRAVPPRRRLTTTASVLAVLAVLALALHLLP